MASILDRYGIKEVADVTFYEIGDDGKPSKPVLFLDTLKVSTIEQTAEQVDARGGKGNPKLITWDYGKEISVSIEDALFSPKSMAIMFGDGQVATATGQDIKRVAVVRTPSNSSEANSSNYPYYFTADIYDATEKGAVRKKVYYGSSTDASVTAGMIALDSAGVTITGVYSETGVKITESAPTNASELQAAVSSETYYGQKVFIEYTAKATTKTITINGDSFPGTYYVQGDTYSRSDVTGKDSFFQFIIPKAKMSAEETITLEAEGDPSTFNMNLTVLRPDDGEMMKLVQYDLESGESGEAANG